MWALPMLMWMVMPLQSVRASKSTGCWGKADGGEDAQDSGRRYLHVRLHYVTAFGQKVWSYLDSMPEAGRPDSIAAAETHLKDVHLNGARRRATSLG